MKFFGLIAIISALAVTSNAMPIDTPAETSATTSPGQVTVNSVGTTPFYITSPISPEVYEQKTEVVTTWINGIDGPFKINVISGNDPTTMQPTDIVLAADGKSGSQKWAIPESIPDGTYAFRYVYKDASGKDGESYSSQFKIQSGKPQIASSGSQTA